MSMLSKFSPQARMVHLPLNISGSYPDNVLYRNSPFMALLPPWRRACMGCSNILYNSALFLFMRTGGRGVFVIAVSGKERVFIFYSSIICMVTVSITVPRRVYSYPLLTRLSAPKMPMNRYLLSLSNFAKTMRLLGS